jgi:apolipoprotein N-acyltransferase
MTEAVPLRVGKTLFTRLGDWPGLFSVAASVAALVLTRRSRAVRGAA